MNNLFSILRGNSIRSGNFVFLILIILILSVSTYSQQSDKIYRIGYFEGGKYFIHKMMLAELKKFFNEMNKDSVELIYEPYGYFSAGWDRDKCRAMANDLARLKNIDLVIAAGPWVIEDLIAAGFEKPIIGIYQFDPEVTGLLDSTLVPVVPNLTVNYQPNKLYTDMAALMELFPSRKIGLLYFPSGDESARFRNKFYKVAGDFGAVVHLESRFSPRGLYSFFLTLGAIKKNVDVLYVSPLWGMDFDQMKQFYRDAEHARLPTFTAEGFLQVGKGATAGNCIYPHRSLAKFAAYKILKIIGGATPSTLPVVFNEIEALCLNLEAGNKLAISFRRNNINNARTIPALSGDTITTYTYSLAIEQALRENNEILLKSNVYQKAIVEAQKAYSAFLPEIRADLGIAGSDNEAEAAFFNRTLNRKFYTDIVFDQRLFSFPAIKAIHIAAKRRAIEEVSQRQLEQDLKQAVTVAYLSVLESIDRVAAYTQIVDRLRDYREMTITDYQLGLNDNIDAALFEERLVRTKIQLFDARSELRVNRTVLNVLLNRPGDDNLVLKREEFSPETMVALSRKFADYTSDLKKQKKFERYLVEIGINNSLEMEKTDLSIGIRKDLISRNSKRFLPEISLRAKYSYGNEFEPKISDRKGSWTIGGMLSLPIFGRAEGKYERKILAVELDELLYRKDSVRFSRWQDITNRADRLATRTSTLPMNYFVKNLSVNNLDSAYVKYNRGDYSGVELLSLEKNATDQEIALITDKYKFFVAYADLLHAIGIGYLPQNSAEAEDFYKNLDEYMQN